MTVAPLTPARTIAIVVGVEKYAAGVAWDVQGPADDACRFVGWLRERGVPQANIRLCLSSLEPNRAADLCPGVTPYAAANAEILDTLNDWLRTRDGDLLLFFWAGHGLMTLDGVRRLYYADATSINRVNLDLMNLINVLRSDLWPGFARQEFIVDACANFVGPRDTHATLPVQTLPQGQPVAGRQQFVLLGAKGGEFAVVDGTHKTGLFSREVLQLLKQDSTSWPPDLERVARTLQNRFVELRNAGQTGQTPTYFWYRDWNDGEGTLGKPTAGVGGAHEVAVPSTAKAHRLAFAAKARLVDLMLDCPTIGDRHRREAVVSQLRPAIARNVRQTGESKLDALHILNTCENYSNGVDELLDIVRFFEGDSTPWQALVAAVKDLHAALPPIKAAAPSELIANDGGKAISQGDGNAIGGKGGGIDMTLNSLGGVVKVQSGKGGDARSVGHGDAIGGDGGSIRISGEPGQDAHG